jgi:DNA repair exonuclease SbcCD ATPase subunit
MRVSVIPTDKIIIIDGNGVELETWTFDDDHIHAIQWMHDKGHIELKTTEPNIEINDISFVQPYIDAYTKTLPSIKERALKAKEEERLRRQKEEAEQQKYLEDKKKESEQVQNLIEQNKKIRAEKLKLEEETSSLIEEIHNTKRHYDIQLERKELEKEKELEVLKNNAIMRELIDKETNIISNYEEIKEQVRQQIDASKKEQQKFMELIIQHQNNIDIEKENLKETKKLLEEQIQLEKEKLDFERQLIREESENYRYKLDYEKDTASIMKAELDAEYTKILENQKVVDEKIEKDMKELALEKFEIAQEKSNIIFERDLIDKEKEDAVKQMDIIKSLRDQTESEVTDYIKELKTSNEKIQKEIIGNLEYDNVSLEDLVNIMNELDPQQVYASLTSGEIDENNFPVEKAVVWFSALKKAMDNK